MRKPYPIYRQVLRLYPQSFRVRYGQEMVQVLSDLLAEETNKLGRLRVWLRISSELPFSIMRENVHSLGGKDTFKIDLRKNRQHITIIVTSVCAVTLLASIGWLRLHALPATTEILFRKSITRTFDAQSEAIGNPLTRLAGGPPSITYGCDFQAAQGISTQIGCQASAATYLKLDNAGSQSSVMESVTVIEDYLKHAGYEDGGNGVTLTSLVGGTYEGKDYSPDAFYKKVIGDYTCIFDTRIAYANPARPAIDLHVWCSRTINILGAAVK